MTNADVLREILTTKLRQQVLDNFIPWPGELYKIICEDYPSYFRSDEACRKQDGRQGMLRLRTLNGDEVRFVLNKTGTGFVDILRSAAEAYNSAKRRILLVIPDICRPANDLRESLLASSIDQILAKHYVDSLLLDVVEEIRKMVA